MYLNSCPERFKNNPSIQFHPFNCFPVDFQLCLRSRFSNGPTGASWNSIRTNANLCLWGGRSPCSWGGRSMEQAWECWWALSWAWAGSKPWQWQKGAEPWAVPAGQSGYSLYSTAFIPHLEHSIQFGATLCRKDTDKLEQVQRWTQSACPVRTGQGTRAGSPAEGMAVGAPSSSPSAPPGCSPRRWSQAVHSSACPEAERQWA